MISKSLFRDFIKFVQVGSLPALCSVIDSKLDHGVKLDALECIQIILSNNNLHGTPGRCVSHAEMTKMNRMFPSVLRRERGNDIEIEAI